MIESLQIRKCCTSPIKSIRKCSKSHSNSSKSVYSKKILNEGVDRQQWRDALKRAEHHEIKHESLVSDIFSLSNLDVSSFKQRSIVLRETSNLCNKEQLNDPYFWDNNEINFEKEEQKVFLEDLPDSKRRVIVETMVLKLASENQEPFLKEVVQLKKITSNHYLVYFNNRVVSLIFDFNGSVIMQFLLFRFSQEALSLLFHEVRKYCKIRFIPDC